MSVILKGRIPYFDPSDPGTEFILSDTPSGMIVERLRPRCFGEVLRGSSPVRCLLSHMGDMVLGITRPGFLRLEEDEEGLHFGVLVEDTVLCDALTNWFAAGNPLGASFDATSRATSSTEDMPDGRLRLIRWVERITALRDVSPTDMPSYTASRCWLA